jgi:hypothetical protein
LAQLARISWSDALLCDYDYALSISMVSFDDSDVDDDEVEDWTSAPSSTNFLEDESDTSSSSSSTDEQEVITGRKCSCGNSECMKIRVTCFKRGERGWDVFIFNSNTIGAILAAKALKLYFTDNTGKLIVAHWHYRDSAFDDNGNYSAKCVVNPEIDCDGILYSFQVIEPELRDKFGKTRLPGGFGNYYSAPTVTSQEYYRQLSTRLNLSGSGRKGKKSAASSTTRDEERRKRAREEMEKFSADVRMTIQEDINGAVYHETLLWKARITELENHLTSLKEKADEEITLLKKLINNMKE